MSDHWICLVDFGGQYTHLIQRNVKELTNCKLLTMSPKKFRNLIEIKGGGLRGIILSGGPGHVNDWVPNTLAKFKCPILGICYGYQVIGKFLGAKVHSSTDHSEYGLTGIKLIRNTHCKLFDDVPLDTDVWMSHMDWVDWSTCDENAIHILAKTKMDIPCAVYVPERKLYGLQFHPEVYHTTHGKRVLSNFLGSICQVDTQDVSETSLLDTILKEITETVNKKEQVLLAVSGGVDSTVVAALLSKALGHNRIHCVFINTGLLRQDDELNVIRLFEELGICLVVLDRKQIFLETLRGVTEPENKRERIGKLFGIIFEQYAQTVPVQWLAQGTIYPDRIESGKVGHESKCIKSHHNLALPEKFGLKVLEPIRNLYKDQVRGLGKRLGIPLHVIHQQPFPGPGLAIRILGEVTEERLRMVRKADHILNTTLKEKESKWYQDEVWQCFVALWATTKTVGVKGDQRSYEHPMAIRIVQSRDAMTARVTCPPSMSVLFTAANAIVNQVDGCNRVLFELTGKPPGTIEYE